MGGEGEEREEEREGGRVPPHFLRAIAVPVHHVTLCVCLSVCVHTMPGAGCHELQIVLL